MINFNKPPYVGTEMEYIKKAIESRKICGDGEYTKLCNNWLEKKTGASRALLTTACSTALDMSAMLANIQPGDEVILPSFTFVSTANAFVLRGAKLVFVDIRSDTQNIDEKLIENAITDKTKVIAPVHYAGIGCEMDAIMKIAEKYNLVVIEDAAQGLMSTYKGKPLGAIGDYGCISFHETKNYSMGEGGALLLRDEDKVASAEIIREKGTNRTIFLKGQVDKYTWVDVGSSYLPSEMNAAYLWAQLQVADDINNARLDRWNQYYSGLESLQKQGVIQLPVVPDECVHNAHMFYIKSSNMEERTELISYLKSHGVHSVFHYVPLHSSPAGEKFGRFSGEDRYTTDTYERLLRLPMFYELTEQDVETVVKNIKNFYKK